MLSTEDNITLSQLIDHIDVHQWTECHCYKDNTLTDRSHWCAPMNHVSLLSQKLTLPSPYRPHWYAPLNHVSLQSTEDNTLTPLDHIDVHQWTMYRCYLQKITLPSPYRSYWCAPPNHVSCYLLKMAFYIPKLFMWMFQK